MWTHQRAQPKRKRKILYGCASSPAILHRKYGDAGSTPFVTYYVTNGVGQLALFQKFGRVELGRVGRYTGGGEGVCSKHTLHVDHIQPAPELEADLFEMGDFLKTKFRVERDAACLFAVDAGDDGVVAES